MSEKAPKLSYHQAGERRVRGHIRNGRDSFEHVGREDDPRVAEAMAYAAKPLIDEALGNLSREPNSGDMATLTFSDGTKGLNKAPGVKTEHRDISYGEIDEGVRLGHERADRVQTEFYDAKRQAEEQVKRVYDNL